jgi:hypothetical protein
LIIFNALARRQAHTGQVPLAKEGGKEEETKVKQRRTGKREKEKKEKKQKKERIEEERTRRHCAILSGFFGKECMLVKRVCVSGHSPEWENRIMQREAVE